MPGPLAGLRVVEFSRGMAGALAGMVLADYGADVVKVDRPGAEPPVDETTRGYLMWHRGKRSIELDLDRPDDRNVAADLVANSDVVLVALAPETVEKLGLGYDVIPGRHDRLVHATISGFGRYSRYAGTRATDGMVFAAIGRLMGLNAVSGAAVGQDRDRPIFVASPIASYAAAQLAVLGVAAALFQREATGLGQRIETSLLQGTLSCLMREELIVEQSARASETLQRGVELCFLTAICADGRAIQMCSRQPDHFRNWLRVLGLEHRLDEPRYVGAPTAIPTIADIEELEAEIRACMVTRTAEQWMQMFMAQDVGADPFLEPAEFLAHPQMVDNDRVVTVDDPRVGPTRQVGLLVHCSRAPGGVTGPAPRRGAHNDEIRRELATRDAAPSANAQPAERQLPLDGITIVELAYFVAGPLGTALLAELGARVVKVEPLAGDPYRKTGSQSCKFVQGKESIAMDLKATAGRRAFERLVERADAFVQSFRVGVAERLAVDEETLRALNPDLVYLFAASYGSKGPEAARIAFHSTPTALTGAGIKQAGRGNAPVDDSFPDPAAGLGVATALVLGLLARRRFGVAQGLETTMLTSTGYVMSEDLVVWPQAPQPMIPDQGQHGLHALYRLYRGARGWMFLSAPDAASWIAAANAFDAPQWLNDPRFATASERRRHDGELTEAIASRASTQLAADLCARLTRRGVDAVEVCEQSIEHWLHEEGLLDAGHHDAYGQFGRLPPKVDLDTPRRLLQPAGIGEHSVALLDEIGLSREEIGAMVADGVVATSSAWNSKSFIEATDQGGKRR